MEKRLDKVKVILSDCHLSAGRVFEGRLNPHEDFRFDEEMCQLFEFFSTGKYGEVDGIPVEVELILAGDYLDYLNVPLRGEFEDAVTEELSLYKTEKIIEGHPRVMRGLKKFASLPGKKITYLIGNHDADLFFPKVRERLTREWDPEGKFPSEKVKVIGDQDRITYEDIGVEVRHGQQFEAASELNFKEPLIETRKGTYLNLPWGSVYILKIINRMKWEREYLDKVRPIRAFIAFGLILDPIFTLRFAFLTLFYFVKARLLGSGRKSRSPRGRIGEFIEILKQEVGSAFQDNERPAREVLSESPKIHTLIMGHTHHPMDKIYEDGKRYINTGTWTKMIQMDFRGFGRASMRTFALVEVRGGETHCELRQWHGHLGPHGSFIG